MNGFQNFPANIPGGFNRVSNMNPRSYTQFGNLPNVANMPFGNNHLNNNAQLLKVQEANTLIMYKRHYAQAVESLQAGLEIEARDKEEAIRQKNKLETDLAEVKLAVENANAKLAELETVNETFQNTINSLQLQIESEKKINFETTESLAASEQRNQQLLNELTQSRTTINQVEKSRKAIEAELKEAQTKITDLNTANRSLIDMKRKLENDLAGMITVLNQAYAELRNSEGRALKATHDSIKLSEELKTVQSQISRLEISKKGVEDQLALIKIKLDETEANALENEKQLNLKMEQKVAELEAERDQERINHHETLEETLKKETRIKELEEVVANQAKMKELLEKLQLKVEAYKKQIEEAEKMAAANLARVRTQRTQFDDSSLFQPRPQSRGGVRGRELVARDNSGGRGISAERNVIGGRGRVQDNRGLRAGPLPNRGGSAFRF